MQFVVRIPDRELKLILKETGLFPLFMKILCIGEMV